MAAVALARREDAQANAVPRVEPPSGERVDKSSRKGGQGAPAGGGHATATGQGDALRDGRRIDPNRASAEELELLPGVGPSLARRLVESRTAQGPFRSSADLRRVKGVGVKTLLRFEHFLSFDSEQLEHTADAQLPLGRTGSLARVEHQAYPHVDAHGPGSRPQVVESDQQVPPGTDHHGVAVSVQP
jgi:competence ComEA-like helix-hairpin-helix protein